MLLGDIRQAFEIPRVGEEIEVDNMNRGVVLEGPANEIGADEPGPTGYQHALEVGHCSPLTADRSQFHDRVISQGKPEHALRTVALHHGIPPDQAVLDGIDALDLARSHE